MKHGEWIERGKTEREDWCNDPLKVVRAEGMEGRAVAPWSVVWFPAVSVSVISPGQEADVLLTLPREAYVILALFISSCRRVIITHHDRKKGEYNTISNLRERNTISI